MVEVIQGNELNVSFEVNSVGSHVTKQFVQYVERETMFGDPVDVTTGAYMDTYEALALRGDAILSLDLSYNSLTSDIRGETGYGWSHNFESRISAENGIIHYYIAPGYSVAFVNEDSLDGKIYGTYRYGEYVMSDTVYGDTITYRSISPYMEGYVLTKNADDTYTMTTPAGYTYDYDSEGNLTRMVMEDKSSVTITRTQGQVIVTEDVSGRRIKLDYTDGMLTAVSDDTGRITRFIYTSGYLTEIINPVGEHIYYSYDENGRLNEAANTNREVFVSNVYDGSGRVISQKDGYGEEITFTYTETEEGLITAVKNPEGISATIVSDRMCNILEVTNEQGVKTCYTYDSDGNMLTSTDTFGNSFTYTYDEQGNPVSKKGSNGEEISLTYNDAGYITGITTGNGSSITYTYNGNNQVVRAEEGDITADYTYDEAGRMTLLAGPEGRVTAYGYEGVSDLPVTVTDAEGNVITMEYDVLGNLVKVTDALGNPTAYQYDAMNRLTRLIRPNGGVISYTYDEYGNINSVTDALGNTSAFDYDVQGRMTGITYADGSRETSAYDALGNLIQRTSADGRSIRYEYDVSGNLTKETYPDGTYKSYTYDPSGKFCL